MSNAIAIPETRAETSCVHERQELRRRIVANGAAHYVMQCLGCGTQVRAVSKDSPEVLRLATFPPPFDTGLAGRYWDDRFARARERWEEADAEWWSWYDDYLESPEWRDRSERRQVMDRHRCQAVLLGCRGQSSQAHHLSYRYVGNEPMFDLISVCPSCHALLHAMRPRKRPATNGATR